MSVWTWLRYNGSSKTTSRSPHRSRSTRPALETLERRDLPSTASAVLQAPLVFEPNVGQADAQVQFVARGPNYSVALTNGNAILNLSSPRSSSPNAVPGAATLLTMSLVGANPAPAASGLNLLSSTSNYQIGDVSQWHMGVANYGQVQYQNVYSGVNVVYYGTQQQLEYDFTVAPHADPSAIQLDFQGMQTMAVDAGGNLVLHTANGDLVEHAPVVYQTVDGTRVPISGQYVIGSQGQAGFQVGTYDPTLPLVIDPVLSYSTFLGVTGGGFGEGGYGVAVDGTGNIYVTGLTSSANFSPLNSIVTALDQNAGGGDGFALKLKPDGTPVYFTYFGGRGTDQGFSIAVDGQGNAYVAGQTSSSNFPVSSTASQKPTADLGSNGAFSPFYLKLNSSGLVSYSTLLAGEGFYVGASALALDSGGNIYITGSTGSPNLTLPNSQVSGPAPANNQDSYAFAAKLNKDNSIAYVRYLGLTTTEAGTGITADSAGNAYVTGYTYANATGTAGNAFVLKLNATGTQTYFTYLGGSGVSSGWAIGLDGSGNLDVTGDTTSESTFASSTIPQTTYGPGGNNDVFVAQLSAAAGTVNDVTYLGGSQDDFVTGLALDNAGRIYLTGQTFSSDFPTQTPLQAFRGSSDAFVTELTARGALIYSTFLGGSADNSGLGIALDSAGNIYLTGVTGSSDFPSVGNVLSTSLGTGISDGGYLAKIGQSIATTTSAVSVYLPASTKPAPNPSTYGQLLTLSTTIQSAGGTTAPTGTVQFLSGSMVLGTASVTTVGGVTSASLTTAALPVGTDSLTAVYSGDGTFSGSSSTAVQRKVNAAPLTITANNATRLYGTPNPSFTASYSGFVLGDGPSVLSGQLTFTTTATPASPPGTYTVTPGGLTSTNYTITFVSGTLTVLGKTYQVVPDPNDPTKSILIVAGTAGDDNIEVEPGDKSGTLRVDFSEHDGEGEGDGEGDGGGDGEGDGDQHGDQNDGNHDDGNNDDGDDNHDEGQDIAPLPGTSFDIVRIYGGSGNDSIVVSQRLTLLAEIYGGSGNDLLVGGGGNNIIVNGAGNSVLVGGGGRNILIGGSGGDTIVGGTGDNLEIAGSTNLDSNAQALEAVMAEWASSDSYATRVNDILGVSNSSFAQRHNGNNFLNTGTVQGDSSPDLLIGGDGQDWFFGDLSGPWCQRDFIWGRESGDTVTQI